MSATDVKVLLKAAALAAAKAYAPYSRYKVGAAIRARDGSVFTGCNVENASYGLTMCAERVAFASAVAAGHRKFTAIAIAASGRLPPYPCGACRQVMAEFCEPDFRVFTAGIGRLDAFDATSLRHLLPKAFALRSSGMSPRATGRREAADAEAAAATDT